MLNDALILFRKEVGNILKDPTALFTNYLLPLLLFPALFSALGFVDLAKTNANRATVFHLAWEGPRDPALETRLHGAMKWAEDRPPRNPETLTVTLPTDYRPGTDATLTLAYDSTRQDLSWAAGQIRDQVTAYADALRPPPPRPLVVKTVDLARPEAAGAGLLAFLLPYLVVLFLFTGSLNLGLTVTVMEKEKGSLASLLVTQVSRTSIAVGKLLFVMASGLVNTLCSAFGMVLGMVIQASFLSGGAMTMGLGALGRAEMLAPVLGAVFAASIFASALVVFVGVKARTMKQAGGLVTPLTMVVIVGAVVGSGLDPATSGWLPLVPLINTVMVIKAGVLGNLTVWPVVGAVVLNLGLGAGLVALTAREYNREAVLAPVS